MLNRIYRKLESLATLQIFGILIFLFILCYGGFQERNKALVPQVRPLAAVTISPPDGRPYGYSPQEAADFFKEIRDGGRKIYALSELTLDVFFPFIYGGILVILLITYWKWRHLLLLPLIAAGADLLENITLAFLALSFDGTASPVAYVASAFTVIKGAGILLSLLLIVAGMLLFLWRALFSPRAQD